MRRVFSRSPRSAAMDVEFDHVLAGVGVGSRHPEHDGLVDEPAIGVREGADRGVARFGG